MTRSQVIAALNGDAACAADSTKQEPLFGLSSVLDIPSLGAACEEIVADSKNDAGQYDAEFVEICREMKRLLNHRTWVVLDPQTKAKRSVLGRLHELQPSQQGGGNSIVVATKKGNVSVSETDVDPASRKLLKKAHDIAVTLSEHYERTNTKPRNAPAPSSASLAIPPRSIDIAGINMLAEFTMSPQGLKKVQFSHSFAGEGGRGTLHASYSTICRLLTEKYGPSDERTDSSGMELRIWRFPKTKISASHVRHDLDGFVREGISVTYEAPSAANSVTEKDKL